jgi:segregation and condensation protein A
VALASVTSQYLKQVESLVQISPKDLEPFIELAAKLLYIKSLALLPISPEPADDNTLADLKQQLAEYEQVQKSASQLDKLWQSGQQTWIGRPQTPFELSPELPPNLNLSALNRLFEQALTKLPPETTTLKVDDAITLEQATRRLRQQLGTGRQLDLTDYLGSITCRIDLIMTFLAILELARVGTISVSQAKPCGDMIISNEEP